MTTSEKRVAALEVAQGKKRPTAEELSTQIERLWAKMGTTHTEQLAHYGTEKALLRAVRESVEADIASRKISKGAKP
jgi:uncharacterized coiled-coil protein SlyX